ncbi:hypothetical protein T265_11136 [Opisthorchis viverrini]|uniref:Uncharacterized protein n=1 Tax=Opisthorchis viverrini TaxID=6198 RepID=A0A074Z032_OPIVI|nr:hypothetical protein T265_11136 [Opisthorchis viverrini]KER20273.1 hypothetical protein T265_11136 [Opisthorchis viverrini]
MPIETIHFVPTVITNTGLLSNFPLAEFCKLSCLLEARVFDLTKISGFSAHFYSSTFFSVDSSSPWSLPMILLIITTIMLMRATPPEEHNAAVRRHVLSLISIHEDQEGHKFNLESAEILAYGGTRHGR